MRLLETVWQSEWGRSTTYALGHEKEKAKVYPADVFDRDGIKALLERVRERFQHLSHLELDAGYNGKGKGKDWVEKEL